MNEYDSNRILDVVKLITFLQKIFQTCYILNTYIRKSYRKGISRYCRLKKEFRNKKPLSVIGCVAKQKVIYYLKKKNI